MHTLVRSESSQEEDVNESSLILEIWDNKDNSKDQESCIESNSQSNDRMQVDDSCDLLFTIDNQPSVKDNFDIPKYGQVCHFYYISIFLNCSVQSEIS